MIGCSAGDRATFWYYVLSGSVLLSMTYFFLTGSKCVTAVTHLLPVRNQNDKLYMS